MGYRTLLLSCFLWIVAGCGQEPTTLLSELATATPEATVSQESTAPTATLATLTVRHPGRLVSIVRPLLGLADDVKSAALVANELERFSGLYGEVLDLSLAFDTEAKEPVVSALRAFAVLRPASGSVAADLLTWWGPRLALLPAWPGGERTVCTPRDGLLVCGPGEDSPPADFMERARVALDGSTAVVAVDFSIPRLLAIAEEFVTVPLLWSVLPEETRQFTALNLTFTEDPDRLALNLVTADSGLVDAFVGVFESTAAPVVVPQDSPIVAFTAVRDLEGRLEKVENFWDNKIPLSKKQKLKSLLDNSWQSQMMELANGTVGVVLMGEVPITGLDPAKPLKTPGLVYFIQVSDVEAMEARLLHVFKKKYFKLEDENFEGLAKFTHASWKKKKKKSTRERLTWFVEGETYYFGLSPDLIRFLRDRKTAVESGTARELALASGEVARFSLSPGGLVTRLTSSPKAGMSTAMALGMVKNTLGEVTGELVVRVHHLSADSSHTVSFEIVGLLTTLKDAIARSESLLKMLPAAQ